MQSSLGLTCPICLDTFEDPVVVACGHTFCNNKCLRNLKPSDDGKFSCPLCKKEFASVDHLPKNYIVESFLHELKTKVVIAATPPVESHFCPANCQNCKTMPATLWCSGCSGISYCQSCSAAVHTIPALKEHKPFPFLENLNTPNYLLCPFHPSKKKEIFCTQCDVAICHLCKTESHQQHVTICVSQQSAAIKSKLQEANAALDTTNSQLSQEFKDCEAKLFELKVHLTQNQKLQRKLQKLAIDTDTRLLTAPGFETKVNKVVRRASASSSPARSPRDSNCPSPTHDCSTSPPTREPSRPNSPLRSPRDRAHSLKKRGETIAYPRPRGGIEDPWTWDQTPGLEIHGFRCKSTDLSGWKMGACVPRSTEGRTEFKWRMKILTPLPPFIGSPSVMLGAISVETKDLVPKAQYFNDGIIGGSIYVPLGTVSSSWRCVIHDKDFGVKPDSVYEFCWSRWKSELEIAVDGHPIVTFSDLPPYIVPACAFYKGVEVVFV